MKLINELKNFTFEGNQVRTLSLEETPYFLANDVAEILGYKRVGDAIKQHVDADNRKTLSYKAFGDLAQSLWAGNDFSNKTIITEAGVYDLIFGSDLPSAQKFKHWVTHEVLPTIRKHGAYMTDQKAAAIVTDKNALADLLQQAAYQLKRKDIQIEQMKPKALFADSVAASDTTILIGELAKIIRGNGVDIGANRLFRWLRDNGYLISRKGSDYNMPTQKSMELGLFKIIERTINQSDGSSRICKTTKVTGKGQQYFINKFLKETA
ncbi:MAG: phage antirepressor KilAC domain-containing protein [Ligilactobacillus ruminis]|nr:phage antirepressor KilAC domain-containing protein [Ligilactobacillus ruminis]